MKLGAMEISTDGWTARKPFKQVGDVEVGNHDGTIPGIAVHVREVHGKRRQRCAREVQGQRSGCDDGSLGQGRQIELEREALFEKRADGDGLHAHVALQAVERPVQKRVDATAVIGRSQQD
jgi:hypothetical protein